MSNAPTYQDLTRAAAARNVSCDEVDQLIDAARVNADDTIFVEHSMSENDWEWCFMESLCQALSYSNDTAAAAWFKAQGVRW